MAITTHTNWIYGSYEADRLYVLRTAENPGGRLDAHFEGTSIAIGYGYDLIQNYATVGADLSKPGIGITLTQSQLNLLSESRTASSTRRQEIASALNLVLPSDAAAQQLFGISVQREESEVDRLLSKYGGVGTLLPSKERPTQRGQLRVSF